VAIPNINPHYFGKAKASEIGDPLSARRRLDFDRLLQVGKVIVYKKGASTDLTVGHFIGIKDNPPPGMYGRTADNHKDCLWWDSIFDAISDSDDSGDSISCHVGGIWKSNRGKESDNDSNGSNGEEETCTGDNEEETSDSGGSNHKADSALNKDREIQDHSSTSGSDYEGSMHSEDGEEWYEKKSKEGDDNESIEDKDPDEWLGVVKWISSDYAFAAGGDSGSLVFATEGNIIIPLGIHVGRPRSGFSIFISLETYCYKAESHGHTLEIC
ncbi:hypothetical protein MMC31_006198, partial [Peltigera leucophlebia]|nr:hypothetical protein [Peltigera leucophlebia]